MHTKTENIEKEVIQDYQEGMSIKDIKNKYNIGRHALYSCLKRNNIKLKGPSRNRNNVNDHYFDDIDSQDKAYFLGLMMADGCIPNYKENTKHIRLEVTEEDRELVDIFVQYLEYDGKICEVAAPKEKIWNGRTINGKPTVLITVCSEQLRKSLIKHGCVPRKTWCLEFPTTVPTNLISHFVRGFFDGDGCVCYNKNQRCGVFTLTANKAFSDGMLEYSKKEFGCGSVVKHGSSDIVYPFQVCGTTKFIKFCDWMYRDATVFLKRKREKYLEIKKTILENQSEWKSRISKERKGENNPSSFLTKDIVLNIRKDYEDGASIKELANKYSIKRRHADHIVRRRIWKHI